MTRICLVIDSVSSVEGRVCHRGYRLANQQHGVLVSGCQERSVWQPYTPSNFPAWDERCRATIALAARCRKSALGSPRRFQSASALTKRALEDCFAAIMPGKTICFVAPSSGTKLTGQRVVRENELVEVDPSTLTSRGDMLHVNGSLCDGSLCVAVLG